MNAMLEHVPQKQNKIWIQLPHWSSPWVGAPQSQTVK